MRYTFPNSLTGEPEEWANDELLINRDAILPPELLRAYKAVMSSEVYQQLLQEQQALRLLLIEEGRM